MATHFLVARYELLDADGTRLLAMELYRNYNKDLVVWAGLPATEVQPLAALALPQRQWTEDDVARAFLQLIDELAPSN